MREREGEREGDKTSDLWGRCSNNTQNNINPVVRKDPIKKVCLPCLVNCKLQELHRINRNMFNHIIKL